MGLSVRFTRDLEVTLTCENQRDGFYATARVGGVFGCTCVVANVTFESSFVCVLSPTIITRPLSLDRPTNRRGETSSRIAGAIKKKLMKEKPSSKSTGRE